MRVKADIPTEDQEQMWLIEWAKTQPKIFDYITHIANQRMCTINYRNKLNRMGQKSGVSDLLLAYPSKGYHGLWIEMKRRSQSRLSDEQKIWIDRMNAVGYLAHVAYGWDHAKEIIESYMSNK